MSGVINSILQWLRAGYPNGVPQHDYVPLLALLSRRLTPDEVKEITVLLTRDGSEPADKADIGVEITSVTDELPSETDIERVRDRLAEAGWPVADPYEPWRTDNDPEREAP